MTWILQGVLRKWGPHIDKQNLRAWVSDEPVLAQMTYTLRDIPGVFGVQAKVLDVDEPIPDYLDSMIDEIVLSWIVEPCDVSHGVDHEGVRWLYLSDERPPLILGDEHEIQVSRSAVRPKFPFP